MSRKTFEQALARCVELRSRTRSLGRPADWGIGFCGIGEPLLNRQTPAFIRRASDEGFTCAMSSNGALLDEATSHAILDAGLKRIKVNVSEVDEEYEAVHELPFSHTRDNVLRFKDLAGDACDVMIILVDRHGDPAHRHAVRQYWRDRGIESFFTYDLINRGGALDVDHMHFEEFEEVSQARSLLSQVGLEPLCPVPFTFLFVGSDGQYYLDSSDWKKEVPLGSVFDVSFSEIMLAKLEHVRSREPVCRSCSIDPVNRLARALREHRDVTETIAQIRKNSAFVLEHIAWLSETDLLSRNEKSPPRRQIPITTE